MKKSGKKTILILGAGAEQTLAIQDARKLKLKVIACDNNPDAVGLKKADIGIHADIRDIRKLVEIGARFQISGIFCHAVEIPHIVARVAEILKLPGMDPDAAELATNKLRRIEHLHKHNIPCARFHAAASVKEAIRQAGDIGFPLVIKPIDNAGARGVRIVQRQADLTEAYNNAINYSHSRIVLLEELMRGPEVSTESIVYRGKIHTFAFADRNYEYRDLYHPYFIENGINFPSVLPLNIQRAVHKLVEKTINVLGIDFGAAKGDIIIHRGKPRIIEMASRTSGGWFGAGSIPVATGVNMLRPLIQMAVGDEPDLQLLKPVRQLGCAQRYIIPAEDGTVKKITGVRAARKMPGVKMFVMFLPSVGDKVHKATNHAERYGQIITVGETREEAIMRCENAIGKIKILLN